MDKPMNQGGFQKEEHPATCSNCGAETTVPFKPTQGRPVYCRDCFKKMRSSDRGPRGPMNR
ncbi:hypothetical protein C4553_02855 [Candidatus Parcubacteria bacterium]|nr:MAG: hypothetical protein C4553_02855 [Candidatus Parcubacteria bacterium]